MNGGVLAPPNLHRIERPHALKIPARRAEYSLTENVASPFQAEPRPKIFLADCAVLTTLVWTAHAPSPSALSARPRCALGLKRTIGVSCLCRNYKRPVNFLPSPC